MDIFDAKLLPNTGTPTGDSPTASGRHTTNGETDGSPTATGQQNTSNEGATILAFMDLVDGETPHKTRTVGRLIDNTGAAHYVPADLLDNQPHLWQFAKRTATAMTGMLDLDGIVIITQCKRIAPIQSRTRSGTGIQVSWPRRQRTRFELPERVASRMVVLGPEQK